MSNNKSYHLNKELMEELKTEIQFKTPLKCNCGNQFTVDVYEWETETGLPTEHGFHFWCGEGLFESCGTLSYDDQIGFEKKIYDWMNENFKD